MYTQQKRKQKIMYKKKGNLKTVEWIPQRKIPMHETNQRRFLQIKLGAYP